ncbi:MAG: DUF692 domain-containing protein [Planctomycetota bacterium]|nr:DUF692 domain-containing protein [Planctomycetota bacterium]
MIDSQVGLAWRAELADLILDRGSMFTEILVEDQMRHGFVPEKLQSYLDNGGTIVPHGISLSLGSAEGPQFKNLDSMNRLVEEYRSPFVSEHISYVESGGVSVGHLTPVPRTEDMLGIFIENVQWVKRELSVPLVLENIAALIEWPGAEMSEAQFIRRLIEETDCGMLLDLSNLYAQSVNHGLNLAEALDVLPLDRVSYMHIAGGVMKNERYHDSHCHSLKPGPLSVLEMVCQRGVKCPIVLEWDSQFPSDAELRGELDAIEAVVKRTSIPR